MTTQAYWPTTPLTLCEVVSAFATARRQEDAILAIYRHAQRPMTAQQVEAECIRLGHKWILQSIRRAISNLASDGALVHLTNVTRIGNYGRPETYYALPGHQAALTLGVAA